MSCRDCLSRREFLTRSTLAVAGAAAVVAGCGDGQIGAGGATAPILLSPISFKVSAVPALATVGQLAFVPTDSRLAVKRTGQTTFLAMSTICTHEGTMIAIVNNNTSFECPNHGARYDSNGSVTRQPQASGSATNLPTYTTSYDAATDTLTISALLGTTTGGED
jgi:cytochrome b6-f complex iron-sulfur subunit